MFVSSTSITENIVRSTQKPESFVAIWDPPGQQQLATKMYTLPVTEPDLLKNLIKQTMEVPNSVRSQSMLRFLLVNELDCIEITAMKNEIFQAIKKP